MKTSGIQDAKIVTVIITTTIKKPQKKRGETLIVRFSPNKKSAKKLSKTSQKWLFLCILYILFIRVKSPKV